MSDVPENYVQHTLANAKPLPPITLANWYKNLNLLNCIIVLGTPIYGLIGWYYVNLTYKTALFSVFYYFVTGLGITAGYHRLWSHRAYNASKPLEWLLAFAGAGAVQGSIKWWCIKHRAHHRYTDTELDPYNAHKGLFWSHLGWVIFKPRIPPGVADVTDLRANPVVRFQHDHYLPIFLTAAFLFPAAVCGLGWGDWWGGLVYAGFLRLTFVHHSTFCVNSLAHWLGESTFDDKHTPRDHLITALVTIGEGYHNFHHQFPMDYRNAIKWFQYDPTKWFIRTCQMIGLASHLKTFPDNEVSKGVLTMKLKKLRETQENLGWPKDSNDLPVVNWETFQAQSAKRPLILVSGFIHDVSTFLDEHPGGRHLLTRFIGKDATTAFFGGVYDHSNAAHNLLAMKRVGVLSGGAPHALDITSQRANMGEKMIPPSQRLKIVKYNELKHPEDYASTTAWEEEGEFEEDVKVGLLKAKGDSLFR